MGYPREASLRGARLLRDRAHRAYNDVRPLIVALRTQGWSCARIAVALNEHAYRTRRGREYQSMQVWRILQFYTEQRGPDADAIAIPVSQCDDP